MGVHTYVGARYVPKFSDKNNGDWDNSYSYEAFEIVKYGQDYYTAKVPVPVGALLNDPTYWALTGNYNGAISTLQGEIDDINNYLGGISVRPEDYGAAGDGVTDDTAAFQAALDSNKNIILTGHYLITSDLIVKHRGTQSEYEKQFIYGGRIIMHNCSFHGNIQYDGGLIFFNVVFTADGSYSTPAFIIDKRLIRTKFVFCKFKSIDYPIDLTNGASDFSQEYNFVQCHFQDGITAFNMDYSQFAGKIIDCDINNYSSYGIYMGDNVTAQNVILSGNVIENCGAGIKLNHVLRDVIIEKSYFEGNTGASIDLTFLESDTGANVNACAIRENYVYLNNDHDGIFMPYRIVNRLSSYRNGSLIPVTFERNALLRGSNQTRDSYYFPNGTPSNYSLDFRFNGNIPSAIQQYLHAYDVLLVHDDYTATSAQSAGTTITLASAADILTLIERSAAPRDFAVAIRNTQVPGYIFISAATGDIRYKLDAAMNVGQSISWSYIYK